MGTALNTASEPDLPELIARIASGDSASLSALYDRMSPTLFALSMRILGSTQDAEETLMDVFLQVWQKAVHYSTDRGSVAAWLIMMVRSRSIDKLRRRTTGEAVLPEHHELPDKVHIEKDFLGSEERKRIRTAVDGLPPEQKMVVELSFFEGLTHPEIAERLELPLGTVKTRIRLALGKLKGVLAS